MAITTVLRTSEVKLLEALNNLSDPSGWNALHFHLSELLSEYQSEYQVKIAVNLIYDLLKSYEGTLFLFDDQSIIVLSRGLEKTLLNKLIFQLRYLYMDDPLAYTEDGQENPAFCTVYDLKNDFKELSDLASRRLTSSVRKVNTPGTNGDGLPSLLSASKLADIEDDVRYADLSRVIRRQPVCAAMPNMAVRRVFDELYINISHLRHILKAEVDFFSNRWLFKYLTQILDQRMLSLIRHNPSRYLDSPISLNLNVETLLSPWFTELDAILKPATKVSIVIEVPVVDVFADTAAFTAAREETQRLGYRVCLDGVTVKSFVNINREKLGLDLVKVQWNADVSSDLNTTESIEFAQAVQLNGTHRVVLCRCDNKQAVEYGQSLGISLFQGRYLDSLINPASKVIN